MNKDEMYNIKNLRYAMMNYVHRGESKYEGPCLFIQDGSSMIEISTGINCDFRIRTPYYLIYGNNSDYIILTNISKFSRIHFGKHSKEKIIKLFEEANGKKYDSENMYKDIFNLVGISDIKKNKPEPMELSINKIQNTFAIIKPDGVKYATDIIDMIYKEGLKIEKYDIRMLDEEILKEHYSHLLDKPFYPTLENYMLSDKVILMVLKGENAIDKLRELMGPTDSTKASKDTIRGRFGTNITYNAIHGSDSKESAEVEINRFFKQKQKRI